MVKFEIIDGEYLQGLTQKHAEAQNAFTFFLLDLMRVALSRFSHLECIIQFLQKENFEKTQHSAINKG